MAAVSFATFNVPIPNPAPPSADSFRQEWADGKPIGQPKIALKLPFAFPLSFGGGNAYDFSPDLSMIVYVKPTAQIDLYFMAYAQ